MHTLLKCTLHTARKKRIQYMKPAHRCRNLLPLFLALALLAGCDRDAGKAPGVGRVSQDLSIGRMRVSIWPEHDDPSLLVIYDGRFEDVSSYPVTTSFLVPAGSVISDACSLSHEGQHFCQLYKTRNQGEFDEVSLTLPYPNFYLSFHTPVLMQRTKTGSSGIVSGPGMT